ncbi:hypothetical protein QBC39DRAFT_384825 [Podospora conica]|nr:hypothetical protein QBC39DRAFT_384825 [Schizothecium conicum]
MKLSFHTLGLVAALVGAIGGDCSPAGPGGGPGGPGGSCTNGNKPYVRKEWRRLKPHERTGYINAVKCLMNSPSLITNLPAAESRYDDFTATHQAQTDFVHFVGIFYPFHRLLLAEYEKALWDCGWDRKLGQPYWDWTIDGSSEDEFLKSPVFHNNHGFGGNGAYIPGNLSHPELPGHVGGPPFELPDRSGGGCLLTGPFAGLSTKLGPQNITTGTTPRCVRRDFSYASLRDFSGEAQIQEAMGLPDFGSFEQITDTSTFHPGGHWAIGGLYGAMTDTYVSPSDPLFYLHHSNMDRAYWSWQMLNLSVREQEISGPLVFFDYANQIAGNATLTTPVWVGLANRVDHVAGDLLHIRKGPFCYTYDQVYNFEE